MKQPKIFFKIRRLAIIAILGFLTLFAGHFYLYAQDKSEFPDGYDAVQAAPNSHKVVFENAFVRVLEVTVPAAGKTEPMHHHRWPSFFLDWDRGGGMPHVRYHRPDGTVGPSAAGSSGQSEQRSASSFRHLERSVDESGTDARH